MTDLTLYQNPALLRRIRELALRTQRKVDSQLGGVYHSIFKGQGLSFLSVRPYEPGDDIRDIDWNVTARLQMPHVKRYVEERELTVIIMFDVSNSASFGTKHRPENHEIGNDIPPKRLLAAEVAALLTLSAISNNDRVGVVLFSNEVQQYIAPRRGKNHAMRLLREYLISGSEHKGTDIGAALLGVRQMLKQRSIIFLISDFMAPAASYYQPLLAVNNRHDLIAFSIIDPLETAWQRGGLIPLRDMETGEFIWADTSSRRWRKAFEQQTTHYIEERRLAMGRAKVQHLELGVQQDFTRELIRFLKKRVVQR